jgi:hypothetical protein
LEKARRRPCDSVNAGMFVAHSYPLAACVRTCQARALLRAREMVRHLGLEEVEGQKDGNHHRQHHHAPHLAFVAFKKVLQGFRFF